MSAGKTPLMRILLMSVVLLTIILLLSSFHAIQSSVNNQGAIGSLYQQLVLQFASPDEFGAEVRKPKYLGCFLLNTFGRTSQVPSSHNVSAVAWCLSLCSKHMYAYYFPYTGKCRCDNEFDVAGLGPSPCANKYMWSTEVYLTESSQVSKYARISEATGVVCSCASSACRALHCSWEKSYSRAIWAGEKEEWDMIPQRAGECESYAARSLTLAHKLGGRYCWQDLNGLLPISTAEAWPREAFMSKHNNLYRIQSMQTPSVVVVLQVDRKKIKVALVTYTGGGNKAISSLFSGHPDSYVMFDPLIALQRSEAGNSHEDDFSNHTELPVTAEKMLDAALDCRLDELPLSSFYKLSSQYNSFLSKCNYGHRDARHSCVQAHQALCHSKAVTVVTGSQTKLRWVKEVQRKHHHDLRIILMLRDPRAVLAVRLALNPYKSKTDEWAKGLCSAMLDDLKTARRFMGTEFRHKILVLRYEDLANDIAGSAETIYRELALGKVPTELNRYLRYLAKGVSEASPDTNSETGFQWRENVPFEILSTIDQECSEVYGQAGYVPINSEAELRNKSIAHFIPQFVIT